MAEEIETIEVIEQVLDNQMFAVAVIGGIVLGAIAFYAYLEWQKRDDTVRTLRVVEPEYIDDEEPVEA